MKKLTSSLCLVAMSVGLFVAGASPSSDRAAAAGPPGGLGVQVLNVPLPVTGTTTTTITGTVPVTGTVTVQNTVPVKAADNPAFQPYAVQTGTVTTVSPFAVRFDVPAGKRLVIEYIGADATLPIGQNVLVNILVTNPDNTTTFVPLIRNDQGNDGVSAFFSVGQSVRLYSSAGTGSVTVNFQRTNGAGSMLVLAAISGYLVDVP